MTSLAVHDRRQTVHLIDHDEVLQHARSKEERVAFLEWHGAAELRLIIVITQVCYLIQVTTHKHTSVHVHEMYWPTLLLLLQYCYY